MVLLNQLGSGEMGDSIILTSVAAGRNFELCDFLCPQKQIVLLVCGPFLCRRATNIYTHFTVLSLAAFSVHASPSQSNISIIVLLSCFLFGPIVTGRVSRLKK